MKSSDISHLQPIVSSDWDGTIFAVRVKNPVICNASINNPAYSLVGHQLTVSYEEKVGNVVLKCYCDTEATFTFSRLPRGNYTLSFKER